MIMQSSMGGRCRKARFQDSGKTAPHPIAPYCTLHYAGKSFPNGRLGGEPSLPKSDLRPEKGLLTGGRGRESQTRPALFVGKKSMENPG